MLKIALLLKSLVAQFIVPIALILAAVRRVGFAETLSWVLAPFYYLIGEPKLTLERYILFFLLFGLMCIKGLFGLSNESEASIAYDLTTSALFWAYVAARIKLHRMKVLLCPWVH